MKKTLHDRLYLRFCLFHQRSRNKLREVLHVSPERLQKLGVTLPPKVPQSAAARMALKKGGWGKRFVIGKKHYDPR